MVTISKDPAFPLEFIVASMGEAGSFATPPGSR